MKMCIRCRKTKQLEDFSIRKDLADGRFPYCLDCKREYDRVYYQRNAEKIKAKAYGRYIAKKSGGNKK